MKEGAQSGPGGVWSLDTDAKCSRQRGEHKQGESETGLFLETSRTQRLSASAMDGG